MLVLTMPNMLTPCKQIASVVCKQIVNTMYNQISCKQCRLYKLE